MTMQVNQANRLAEFRILPIAKKIVTSLERPQDIVTPRFVIKLTNGRELVMYGSGASEVLDLLITNGFESYEKVENGLTELIHVNVRHHNVLTVSPAGGLRRDGTYDFGGAGTKLIADNNPSRETQQGKPALK